MQAGGLLLFAAHGYRQYQTSARKRINRQDEAERRLGSAVERTAGGSACGRPRTNVCRTNSGFPGEHVPQGETRRCETAETKSEDAARAARARSPFSGPSQCRKVSQEDSQLRRFSAEANWRFGTGRTHHTSEIETGTELASIVSMVWLFCEETSVVARACISPESIQGFDDASAPVARTASGFEWMLL